MGRKHLAGQLVELAAQPLALALHEFDERVLDRPRHDLGQVVKIGRADLLLGRLFELAPKRRLALLAGHSDPRARVVDLLAQVLEVARLIVHGLLDRDDLAGDRLALEVERAGLDRRVVAEQASVAEHRRASARGQDLLALASQTKELVAQRRDGLDRGRGIVRLAQRQLRVGREGLELARDHPVELLAQVGDDPRPLVLGDQIDPVDDQLAAGSAVEAGRRLLDPAEPTDRRDRVADQPELAAAEHLRGVEHQHQHVRARQLAAADRRAKLGDVVEPGRVDQLERRRHSLALDQQLGQTARLELAARLGLIALVGRRLDRDRATASQRVEALALERVA